MINVTPLIDVLLVLLIIFMVIVPLTPKGMQTLLPQPQKQTSPETNPETIVVQVLSDGTAEPRYKINGDSFAKNQVEPKLAEIFAARQQKVMFVKGDPDLKFHAVAEVIDFGHQAGVESVGILTPNDGMASGGASQ